MYRYTPPGQVPASAGETGSRFDAGAAPATVRFVKFFDRHCVQREGEERMG